MPAQNINQAWLKTAAGQKWLQSYAGIKARQTSWSSIPGATGSVDTAWLETSPGQQWLQSPAGRRYPQPQPPFNPAPTGPAAPGYTWQGPPPGPGASGFTSPKTFEAGQDYQPATPGLDSTGQGMNEAAPLQASMPNQANYGAAPQVQQVQQAQSQMKSAVNTMSGGASAKPLSRMSGSGFSWNNG